MKIKKITLLLKEIKKSDPSFPIHPLLLAVYPILFLYSSNIDELLISEIINPIFISIGTTVFIFYTLKFILNNSYKAAFITSAVLIIFFSYGHLFNLIDGFSVRGFVIGRSRYLLPLALSLFVLLSLIALKTKTFTYKISKFLNIIVALLIIFSLINIGNYALTNGIRLTENTVKDGPTKVKSGSKDATKLPDIYYIILDGYARESTLKKVHGYDNSGFVNYLENKGFYVANKSQSNYSLTIPSLASSLNFRYLDDLVEKPINDTKKRKEAIESIRNNEVSKLLKSKGYTYIGIGTGWAATDKNRYVDIMYRGRQRSEFTKILYQTSLLVALERYQLGDADSILFAFDKLTEIPNNSEPTFTFAHFVSPHPPYLFDKDGNKLRTRVKGFNTPEAWEKREKYVDQLIFLNKKTKTAIDEILSKSKIQPIIIIQGDHGTGSLGSTPLDKVSKEKINERMDILNAYYLPKGGDKELYETITPVNSFRKIFNFYFDTDYRILEDVSYYSQYRSYFNFIISPSEPPTN